MFTHIYRVILQRSSGSSLRKMQSPLILPSVNVLCLVWQVANSSPMRCSLLSSRIYLSLPNEDYCKTEVHTTKKIKFIYLYTSLSIKDVQPTQFETAFSTSTITTKKKSASLMLTYNAKRHRQANQLASS